MFTSELQSFSFVNLLDILEFFSFLTIPKKTTPQFQKGSSPLGRGGRADILERSSLKFNDDLANKTFEIKNQIKLLEKYVIVYTVL